MPFHVINQHTKLVWKGMNAYPYWILKKTSQVDHGSRFAHAMGKLSQPYQIQHQGSRQDRVATLPDELHAHLST